MNKIFNTVASKTEINYVQVLSRKQTIKAYKNWIDLSNTENLLLKLFVNESTRILDLGCGTGRIPKSVVMNKDKYLGIDCSHEMINAAKIANPNFEFVCEDILSPSKQYGYFDAVLLMNNVVDMLHPIQRRIDVFNLIKEYLTATGVLIFSSHLLHDNYKADYYIEDYHGSIVNTYRSTMSELCKEVEDYGFEIRIAARDYRVVIADWIYIVATLK